MDEKDKVEKFQKKENYFKIIGLIVDVGTETLQDVLKKELDSNSKDLKAFLTENDEPIRKDRNFNDHWRKILTKPDPDVTELDTTILNSLLTHNIFGMVKAKTDLVGAVRCLKNERNAMAHKPCTYMPKDEFVGSWDRIKSIILKIAGQAKIDLAKIKQKVDEIYNTKINFCGERERRWLETFRQIQLQELKELEQTVDKIQTALNEENPQLDIVKPMLEEVKTRLKQMAIMIEELPEGAGIQACRDAIAKWYNSIGQRKKKVKYHEYDAYIFYAKSDNAECKDFVGLLKEKSKVTELKISLYEDLGLEGMSLSEKADFILENCRLILFFITDSFSFQKDALTMFETEMCLKAIIDESSFRAIPLWTKPKSELKNIPRALDCLTGLSVRQIDNAAISKFDREIELGRKKQP